MGKVLDYQTMRATARYVYLAQESVSDSTVGRERWMKLCFFFICQPLIPHEAFPCAVYTVSNLY